MARDMRPIVTHMGVYPVCHRFKASFQISRGTIGGAGTPAHHVLVSLTSSEGTGWGESRPSHLWSYETRETVTSTLEGYLRPCIEGHDPSDLEGLHSRMDAVIAPGITRGQPIAKSAIDIAAHDLFCRAEDVSIYRHLGGKGTPSVRLTYLISAASPQEAAEQTREAGKMGYHGFKIKIGKGLERDLEIISACRDQARNAFLWADANQAYDARSSLKLAREASRFDLHVLEQPLRATDRHEIVELSNAAPVAIAIDESVYTLDDLRDFISWGFSGAVVIKTAKSGGIMPAKAMMELARDHGMDLLGSGLTEGMVGFSASLQLFAAMGIEHPVDLNGPQFIEDRFCAGPRLEGERATVSGPGLGVRIGIGKR